MMIDPDKTSILIVDDLPEKHLVYQSILEEMGQNMVHVRSGEEALKQVLKQDFAVILLDVEMTGGMNGFETANLIRGRKRSAHTPIIFLTAFNDEVHSSRGYATGAVDYMSTPVVPEILRAKVRVFVELFRMRQQVARQAEEQAKRAAAEESARRSTFLAEASRALASSLDFEATLYALTRLAVPDLADLSLVTLADEGGGGRTACAWVDPEQGVTVLLSEAGGFRLQSWLAERIGRVLASDRHEFLPKLTPPAQALEPTEASEANPGNGIVPAFPNFPIGSMVIVPLVARGKALGVLTLATRSSGRSLTPDNVSLTVEVSGRAGVALDNALLVRDIQENDRRKNEFLAMLSHELRNPLAPVQNAVHILGMSGIEHPRLTWARDVIDRQVRHLVRLVDDLLDVSRITRGKIRLQTQAVKVADVVASAVETSRPLIESHTHELTVSLPESPLAVRADPARLSQVLSNLLNNAAKYTPDGGRIGLTVESDAGQVVFRVRDTGTGIQREMLAKVFDLFTQADCSIERSQGGLGIGLTLVRRLVEMHGGSVQAFSDGPGRGSEFVVRLAALQDEPDKGPAVTVVPSHTLPPDRILVVDDNVDAADSLAILLRYGGHEVRLAHDGLVALEMAREFGPQVVLLDIGLPGLDGYQVARRLREAPGTSRCLLIAISGYGQEEDRARSKEAGFDHHLTKPVDFDVLQQVMSAARKEELVGK